MCVYISEEHEVESLDIELPDGYFKQRKPAGLGLCVAALGVVYSIFFYTI